MANKTIATILNLKDNFSDTIKKTTQNTNAFTKEISNSKSIISNFSSGVTSTFKGVTSSVLGLAGTYMGVKTVFDYVKGGIEMSKNSEAGVAQLGAVLTSTNNAIGMSKESLLALAGSYGSFTTYGKGAVLTGENLLLTFTNIGKDILPDVTTTMLDMSTALKQDVSASAIQLGKALNNPTQGLTALKRVGVSFSDAQVKQIKTMQSSGDTIGAQKLMLQELQKEFGGSAKAMGETLPGKIIIMQNAFKGIQKTIGDKFIPILYSVYEFGVSKMPAIKEFFTSTFSKIGDIVKIVVTVIKDDLIPLFENLWTNISPTIFRIKDGISNAFTTLTPIIGEVLNFIKTTVSDNKQGFEDFITSVVNLGKTIYNSVKPAIEELSNNILPALKESFSGNSDIIKDILKNATDTFNYINDHWGYIAPVIVGITGAIVEWKLALMAVEIWTGIVAFSTSIYGTIELAIWGIVNATTAWEGIQWLLNVAMDANPVGVVILAITALGVIIYEVVTHWKEICKWVKNAWDIISNNPIADFILSTNPLTAVLYNIIKHFDDITSSISKAWDWLKDWIGTDVPDKHLNVNTTETITTSNKSGMYGTSNDQSSQYNGYSYGHNATGTDYWKGGASIVGEHGAELITNLPSGAKVSTASETQKILSGNRGSNVYNFYFTGNVGTEEFFNQAGEFIVDKLNLNLINT